jgi:hypothetical protein
MPYLWFEWAQDDKLSQICKDAKDDLREKMVTEDVVTTNVNVLDVNVATKSRIT